MSACAHPERERPSEDHNPTLADDKLLKATRISDLKNNELHGNRKNGKFAEGFNMKAPHCTERLEKHEGSV